MGALNQLTDEQVPGYVKATSLYARLPFVTLLWGMILWHVALMILMFGMCSQELGIFYTCACSLTIAIIIRGLLVINSAVEEQWAGGGASNQGNFKLLQGESGGAPSSCQNE